MTAFDPRWGARLLIAKIRFYREMRLADHNLLADLLLCLANRKVTP